MIRIINSIVLTAIAPPSHLNKTFPKYLYFDKQKNTVWII